MGVFDKSSRDKLIQLLKKNAIENNSRFWKDIAERLDKPKNRIVEVNVGKISRYAKAGETVVVPGVVLGAGNIEEAINVAALYFTETARRKIEEAGGRVYELKELLEINKTGSKLKIMG